MRTPPGRRAFTLVEVLVSIGIIGLLLGLLLPALSGVRTASLKMQCQSNLRQMSLAAQHYAAIWEAWPTAIRYDIVDGVPAKIAWDWVTTYSTGELISPGPLWAFTDHPDRVMQCPGYQGDSNFKGDPFTGYNYNTSYLGGEAMWVDVGWEPVRMGVPPHACARADRTAMFGCGGWKGGANKFMRAPVGMNETPQFDSPHSLSIKYSGGQAFHYAGTTNTAYIDGHVASVNQSREGNRATRGLLNDYLAFPKNGFLSDNDSAYDPR